MELKEDDFVTMKSMLKEVSELCAKFRRNIYEENIFFKYTKDELNGMPEYWFTEDKVCETVDNKKYYRVTLKYPDYFPMMEYAKSEKIRHTLYNAYNTRSQKENPYILERAVKLRYKIAKLLGYNNYADYKTEKGIIKTGKNALEFLNNLKVNFKKLFDNEIKNLLNFAQNYPENPINKNEINPWEVY